MKPTLLLIPGMFNTADIWQPVVERLGTQVDVSIADLLTQDSIGAMAQDAWRLVADLPPGTPLVVAGFSMGGYVAIELLEAHRERVHAVAFIDTSARVETADSIVVREKTVAALERNFTKAVDGTITFGLHPINHHDTALRDGMRRMMHAVGAPAAIRQIRALIARADHRDMLSRLSIPALVVCGSEDKVVPSEWSRELASLIPGARLEQIENAGHMTPLEQPALLAQLLLSLTQAVPVPVTS